MCTKTKRLETKKDKESYILSFTQEVGALRVH